jgi:predicted NBD/HSP70 family sugar kinase
MSWSAITAVEVLQEFNPKEAAQIATIQGAADNLTPILARIVNAARACVIAGGGQVDQAGKIPDQLREDVISIARWRWLISLPEVNETLQSKNRRDDYDSAMKRMDDVAAGKIKIELPTAPIVQAAPDNAIEVASSQTRRFTRDQMEGM